MLNNTMHDKYWSFIQKTLIESRLAEKYQALVSKALLSNPVEAQDAFDARVNQYNVLMAGIPYSSVVGLYNRSERIGTERLV